MKKVIKSETRTQVVTINDKPSLTQQHHKELVDVNNIIKRYRVTGELPTVKKQGRYVDLSGITDYHSAMNTVLAAQDSFMSLPSEIRKKFSNDPQELIAYLQNPQNNEEAIKLGLKIPKQETTKTKTETHSENQKQNTTPPQTNS